MMSHPNLLGLHPESFTSFCSAPPQTTRPTVSERALLTEVRIHLSATPLQGQSGDLAGSIPVTQMKYQDFEESVPSVTLPPLTSRCSATVKLFFQLGEGTATTKTRRTPHLFQNRLAPSLAPQARETRLECSFCFR